MDELISKQDAIDALNQQAETMRGWSERYAEQRKGILTAVNIVEDLPPAQQNMSEEYAKAVRNWLVNYQIKCAELKGRYTPYEVLGWIVSDWRKENGIW